MRCIRALKNLVCDAFARRVLARQPREGEPESLSESIGTITSAARTVRGVKWYLTWQALAGIGFVIVMVPLVIYLNAKGIGFAGPGRPQPTTGSGTLNAAAMAQPAPMPAQATTVRPAGIRESSAAPQLQAPITPTVTDPDATASQASPESSAPLSDLLTDTLDTVAGATSALNQLLTAEENGVATTWCPLATTLDIAECDSELGAQWAGRHAQTDKDSVTDESVTVSQPVGAATQYTYSIQAGADTTRVTMVWGGQQWRLSDQDYQQALLGGGILTPLLGSLASVVLNVL